MPSITYFMSHVTQNTLFIKICYMITCNVTSHIIEPIVLHCMQYTRHKKEEPQRGSSQIVDKLDENINWAIPNWYFHFFYVQNIHISL